jgi:hypothetical protein
MRAFILSGAVIKTQLFIANNQPVPHTLGLGFQAVDLWRWLKGDGTMRQLRHGIVTESTEFCALEEIAPEDFRLLLVLWVWQRQISRLTKSQMRRQCSRAM